MMPISTYESLIDVASPNILQGDANAQTNTALLWTAPSGRASGTSQRIEGVAVGFYSLLNRSGGAAYVGLGVRIPNHLWEAGQWVDATTTYTDDTVAAQDRTAADFPLETLTASDGFMIASRVPFNAILIDVSTASNLAGAPDPVRAARYSNAAGTGWSALTTILHTAASVEYSTSAETVIAWDVPTDWGVHVSGLGTGTPITRYLINVRATTAPDTTAGVATAISLYRIYFLESIANNATKEMNFSPAEAWMPYGDGLTAFFSVANASNRVTTLVRTRS